MYTLVVSAEEDPGVTGRYVARTCGSWSANSFLDTENYPAAGHDYVLQSTPNTFSRFEDELSVTYNYNPTEGINGQEFWRENRDINYVRYALEDDPTGIRQCKSFILSTISFAPLSSGEYRQINSYYVHGLPVSLSPSLMSDFGIILALSVQSSAWQSSSGKHGANLNSA